MYLIEQLRGGNGINSKTSIICTSSGLFSASIILYKFWEVWHIQAGLLRLNTNTLTDGAITSSFGVCIFAALLVKLGSCESGTNGERMEKQREISWPTHATVIVVPHPVLRSDGLTRLSSSKYQWQKFTFF